MAAKLKRGGKGKKKTTKKTKAGGRRAVPSLDKILEVIADTESRLRAFVAQGPEKKVKERTLRGLQDVKKKVKKLCAKKHKDDVPAVPNFIPMPD